MTIEDETTMVVVKVPFFTSKDFWPSVFAEAKKHGVPVVFVQGGIKVVSASGGGATVNYCDRMFGFRGGNP